MSALPDSVLVFDVGGSHISAALCSLFPIELLHTIRVPLPKEPSVHKFLDALIECEKQVRDDRFTLCGAAMGIAGPFDYSMGISKMRHKLEYLYGFDLKGAIAERFGWSRNKVLFLKDADAFLLGEIHTGVASHADKVMGITLGTGIGSAFAENGSIVTSGKGVPPDGEIWNLAFDHRIVEDLISTRGLLASYQRLVEGNQNAGAEVPDVAAIASSAAFDERAKKVFLEFGHTLGEVIREVATCFAPEVIVLGGGISRASHLFLPAAIEELQNSGIRPAVSAHIDESALVGAAVYWLGHMKKAPNPSGTKSAV